MNALEIKGLNKSYKNSNFHLNDINITIPKGMVMAIVGRNGSGKSTIINSIFNIVEKDSGQIMFYGDELNNANKKLKESIGVVFDTHCFYPELSIKYLEKVFIDLYKSFDRTLFNSYLDKFSLPKDKKIKTFSRGMGMKLSIAVALSHGAKLLVLDEATAGLDPVAREEILDIFLDFMADENNSIFISSHITSDLERIADYITFIDNGKIILTEAKDNLIYNYGIARIKESDYLSLDKSEYIAARTRGLQIEVLIKDKKSFISKYPELVVDNASVDEILPLLTKGDN